MKDVPQRLMLTPVPTEFVDAIWGQVEDVLRKSVDTARGKLDIDDVYKEVMSGEYVLWIVVDYGIGDEIIAAITTKLLEYPKRTAMSMDWIGGTRMREWLPIAQETISRYAKEHGCSHLEGYGRKAWGRWLGQYGWEPEYIAYRMELD